MSKKHFISLADTIIWRRKHGSPFTAEQVLALARFCSEQNSRFDRARWLSYIAGECGPNGGQIKGGK